jgi:hypothetical protein
MLTTAIDFHHHAQQLRKFSRYIGKLGVPSFKSAAVHASCDLVHVVADAPELAANPMALRLVEKKSQFFSSEVALLEKSGNAFPTQPCFLGDSVEFFVGETDRRSLMVS